MRIETGVDVTVGIANSFIYSVAFIIIIFYIVSLKGPHIEESQLKCTQKVQSYCFCVVLWKMNVRYKVLILIAIWFRPQRLQSDNNLENQSET